jgi:predicted dithiol-disulfide oxidoreductase (DUF899 family)
MPTITGMVGGRRSPETFRNRQEDSMSKQEGPAIPAPSMCEPFGEFEVVSKEVWNEARKELLKEEKALMKVRDRLIAKRRRLPVTEVERGYRFIGPEGETDLLGLFQGRRQLIVYRFFYAPDVENWPDGACSGCSMFADTIVHPAHVAARDTTVAFVAAAPMDHIERLRKRMGWGHIPFYSLPDDRFSKDFEVAEQFGLNVFIQCDGRVYRTYFLNARGIEDIGSTFSLLDLTPLGRQEKWQDVPPGRPQGEPYTWWRLHDHYGKVAASHPRCTEG